MPAPQPLEPDGDAGPEQVGIDVFRAVKPLPLPAQRETGRRDGESQRCRQARSSFDASTGSPLTTNGYLKKCWTHYG